MIVEGYSVAYWPLDPSLLGQHSNPKDFGELEAPLRDSIWTMRLDCHAATGGWIECNSGYRTAWMQWLLRHERVPGHEFDSRYPGSPRTALPGSSNHQRRKACDLLYPSTAAQRWCRSNAWRYGLAYTVSTENWHVERKSSSSVPLRAYPGPTYDGHPAPPPVQPPPPIHHEEDDDVRAIIAAKSKPHDLFITDGMSKRSVGPKQVALFKVTGIVPGDSETVLYDDDAVDAIPTRN